MLTFALIVVCLLVVIAAVGGPLHRAASGQGPGGDGPGVDPELEELEADRAAKLQEIREAELDWRTGKLTDADYGAIDAQLRGEAAAILRRIDSL